MRLEKTRDTEKAKLETCRRQDRFRKRNILVNKSVKQHLSRDTSSHMTRLFDRKHCKNLIGKRKKARHHANRNGTTPSSQLRAYSRPLLRPSLQMHSKRCSSPSLTAHPNGRRTPPHPPNLPAGTYHHLTRQKSQPSHPGVWKTRSASVPLAEEGHDPPPLPPQIPHNRPRLPFLPSPKYLSPVPPKPPSLRSPHPPTNHAPPPLHSHNLNPHRPQNPIRTPPTAAFPLPPPTPTTQPRRRDLRRRKQPQRPPASAASPSR